MQAKYTACKCIWFSNPTRSLTPNPKRLRSSFQMPLLQPSAVSRWDRHSEKAACGGSPGGLRHVVLRKSLPIPAIANHNVNRAALVMLVVKHALTPLVSMNMPYQAHKDGKEVIDVSMPIDQPDTKVLG